MGTYKGIQGYRVESLASDPGTISEVIGKVWYNSGSNVWKVGVEGAGAWSAGTVLNQGRNIAGYAGTSQTSALIFGGSIAYPYNFPAQTEQYDGTSWTELANQNTPRARGGSNGTATAALWFGGFPASPTASTNATEIWDNTSWTTVANLNAPTSSLAGAGGPATPTAALAIGGGPEPVSAVTEEWNGTSWTDGGTLLSPASDTMACGISTAALCIGGSPTPRSQSTEEYNGTSWTAKNNANNRRVSGGASGTTTAALQFGGYDSNMPDPTNTNTANVEKWNGTAWTEVANIAVRATTTGGCSTSSTSTMKVGGYSGPPEIYYNYTEEWADPVIGAKTITTS